MYHTAVESLLWRVTRKDTHSALQCFASRVVNLIRQSCGGFCLRVCMCVCGRRGVCVCVSRPLWSPLIPNLTDILQKQPLMCAESLAGILDATSLFCFFGGFFALSSAVHCFAFPPWCQCCPAGQVAAVLAVCLRFRCVLASSLICNFTSLSSFNPILILCKPSNLWP